MTAAARLSALLRDRRRRARFPRRAGPGGDAGGDRRRRVRLAQLVEHAALSPGRRLGETSCATASRENTARPSPRTASPAAISRRGSPIRRTSCRGGARPGSVSTGTWASRERTWPPEGARCGATSSSSGRRRGCSCSCTAGCASSPSSTRASSCSRSCCRRRRAGSPRARRARSPPGPGRPGAPSPCRRTTSSSAGCRRLASQDPVNAFDPGRVPAAELLLAPTVSTPRRPGSGGYNTKKSRPTPHAHRLPRLRQHRVPEDRRASASARRRAGEPQGPPRGARARGHRGHRDGRPDRARRRRRDRAGPVRGAASGRSTSRRPCARTRARSRSRSA